MVTLSEAVIQRIRYFCVVKKMTPNKLATESGIIQSTINSILKGESRNPKMGTLRKICKGFGISLIDFLDDPIFDDAEVYDSKSGNFIFFSSRLRGFA